MVASPQVSVDWKDFWDIVAHIGTVIGLVATGVWAYFNFIKSRRYYPRLELLISGEIVSAPERQFVIPRVTLKNIGMSKVKLIQKGSGYRIWTVVDDGAGLRELQWMHGGQVYEILEEHKWIEPGESVFDETRIFSLPQDCIAVKIQTRLVAQVQRLFDKNAEWNCSAILHGSDLPLLNHPNEEGLVMAQQQQQQQQGQQQQQEQKRETQRWEKDKADRRENDSDTKKDEKRDKSDSASG